MRVHRKADTARPVVIAGFVEPGFEAVRQAFVDNFTCRDELGAACCIYHRGEKVVDLWGGVRKEATGEPWEADTMVIVYSTTKGMAGLAMALAQSRGLFDYDERIATYWPEFAAQGKGDITVRHLLAHQAGLFAFPELGERATIADPERLAMVLARQVPAHAPGERLVYHALTLGYYESELLRRVDPQHRSLGRFFQDEIATPLGIDFYIRLPGEIPNARLATIRQAPIGFAAIRKLPLPMFLAGMNPRSELRRALVGSLLPLDDERVYARDFEVPAGGGVGTARAIARAYGVFACGGGKLGLRAETLRQLAAPPVLPREHLPHWAPRFSLGFMKPGPRQRFGSPAAFGMPGSGGSFGFADPLAGIGYGYVTNRLDWYLEDPRDAALRAAMWGALGLNRRPCDF